MPGATMPLAEFADKDSYVEVLRQRVPFMAQRALRAATGAGRRV